MKTKTDEYMNKGSGVVGDFLRSFAKMASGEYHGVDMSVTGKERELVWMLIDQLSLYSTL